MPEDAKPTQKTQGHPRTRLLVESYREYTIEGLPIWSDLDPTVYCDILRIRVWGPTLHGKEDIPVVGRYFAEFEERVRLFANQRRPALSTLARWILLEAYPTLNAVQVSEKNAEGDLEGGLVMYANWP